MSTLSPRPGKILVMFAIVLTVLLGIVGLVLDGGLMMASRRQTQNVADSAALAAAVVLWEGGTKDQAIASARQYVRTYNNLDLADDEIVVNIPPLSGPHANNNRYAEVILTRPYQTLFIQVVGADRDQQVQARAVAGYETETYGEGAIVLNPYAVPGLRIQGGAILKVDGSVIVNSAGTGVDAWGDPVDWGLKKYALVASGGSTVKARYVQVVGGVDSPVYYQKYDSNDLATLKCGSNISPDPLRHLRVPQQALNNAPGVTNWTTRQEAVTVENMAVRDFTPGIYAGITVKPGGTARFQAGVYIISPPSGKGKGGEDGLDLQGGSTATTIPNPNWTGGSGVMFYLTGSNYLDGSNPAGYWDTQDGALDHILPTSGSLRPPPPAETSLPSSEYSGTVRYASFSSGVAGGGGTPPVVSLPGLTFPPPDNPNDPTREFNGLLIYQRRRNTSEATITANMPEDQVSGFSGTIYAKWANFKVTGGGRYNARFVVGSMTIDGNATVTINNTGQTFSLPQRVFLVE